MALTLEEAEKIIQGARQKATEMGLRISIAVVDAGGYLMALSRMDGSRLHQVDLARDKAFTSAVMQRESSQMPPTPFFANPFTITGGRVTPLGGGVPIRQGDEVVGGVGVSGGNVEQDIECAKAGLAQL